MFLAKISITRPVLTTVGLLVFLIFGALAYFTLNLNLFPDVEIPYVTVSTVYPGAGPKEVETLISKKIEDAVSTVSLLERVESYSLDGVSIVILQFGLGKQVDIANQEVKDKIDAIINELPEDAELPLVQKVDIEAYPIMDVVLSGNLDSRQLYEIADKTLKDRFSQVNGVANVNISGGQEREIRVQLNNRVVFENTISLPQLVQLLKMHNMDIPGGYFNLKDQEYTVRLEGEYQDVEAIKELELPTPYGPKKIRQFGEVVDGGKDVRRRAVYYDNVSKIRNENVIRLGIVKSPDGNVVKVAGSIRNTLPEIQQVLPEGCKLEIINDLSEFTESSVSDTMSNIYLGILFTSIVLLFFLHDIRSTIIVALSMPTSIISTFLLLKMAGLSLNMMTLMGLSVSVGVLVANSVVVLENIFRYKDMGKNNKDAAYEGTSEVLVAVLASTLTNLVVFLPLANMSSIVGQYLKELALAASFATIFSLLFSFTLTPMLASLILPREAKKGNRLSESIEKKLKQLDESYRKTLRAVLRNKKRSVFVMLITLVIFVLTLGFFGSKLGFEFLPIPDDGLINIEVEMPEGYNLDATAKIIKDIEKKIARHPEVKHVITNLGQLSELDVGTNMALMNIQLVKRDQRDIGHQAMVSVFVKELAEVPNAKIKVNIAGGMGEGGAPIQFYLMGQDLDVLDQYKDKIISRIKDIPGLINLDNSSRAGKPEITIFPDRKKLSEAGLTITELALTLRASIEGLQSTKYREFGNEYDVTITLDDESVNTPEKIGNITVVSPVVGSLRLSQLAEVKFTTGYTRILHRDKFTSIMFTGAPAEGVPIGNITGEIDKRLEDLNLPSGYYVKWGGDIKMMNEMIADMFQAFFIAILLTYLLMAAMLESFVQPIPIMFTLPLALIGVVIIMYFADTAFSLTALMGVIMLIGIVVNNAILMLDYTNQLRRGGGMHPKDALIEACPTKLRPIIMATLALILGMLPMALGMGESGIEIRQPLGVVSIGGLVASTILTLYVIPAFYYVTARVKKEK
ncbi:MAG: efflux RND transporter permease subunit [Ignavibacteriales bacterium]|jgi:HAE1 family hydrophobic/amphiphilic exporter-1|nr:efflux RND transporter permease subunit [Ignavibacteriaceae bacterium]NLH62328.1 efflux RND transporter permease subunit [Ignavibacteriales bacterium]HOJ18586.1 efflux RND transporter permease subunit [Ignavibacteriaceae bacterium]HPO55459.1 efflux RND transporter permease subunit [Ignavibacteriaceae bacterium]